MPTDLTALQFWSGILLVLIPQLFGLAKDWRAARAQEKQTESQESVSMTQAQTENWERLVQNYAKQIESMQTLQNENAELRTLPLKLVIQEQEMKQCAEDKEDWKRYAQKLADQIKGFGQIPLPFRRTPSDGNTEEKIPANKPQQIEAAQQEKQEN